MAEEKYDDLIIGSGIAGRITAWTRDSSRRTVIVERGLLGGACPNVACLPSKNLIWSAKVISLARSSTNDFGLLASKGTLITLSQAISSVRT